MARRARSLALDGLRGIAVLLVVLVHTGAVPLGWIGVDLFFVLSGFLITGILLDARPPDGGAWRAVLTPFYARRALRILPLATLYMALVFFALPLRGKVPPVPALEQLWFWSYLSNWFMGPRSLLSLQVGHFWSLALEEQFYLFWPLLVLVLPRRRFTTLLLFMIVLAPLLRATLAWALYPQAWNTLYDRPTFVRMDGLVWGSLVAVLSRSDGGLRRWRTVAVWTLPLSGAAALFAATRYAGGSFAHGSIWTYVVSFAALAPFFSAAIVCALTAPAGTIRWLEIRPLRWIGTVSYGIYVLHVPVTYALGRAGSTVVTNTAGTLIITFVLAAASWYLFERPILSLKDRWPMPANRARNS